MISSGNASPVSFTITDSFFINDMTCYLFNHIPMTGSDRNIFFPSI